MKKRLYLPGPVEVPDSVARAMSAPMINHRAANFGELFKRVSAGVQKLFQTQHDVYLYTSSGTGMWEAAIVNFLSPGDRVLSLVSGDFGVRWAKMADRFGLSVHRLESEFGRAVNPAEVQAVMEREGPFKAVFITHNETSTSVVNPVREVAQIARKHGALVMVDAISGLLVSDLPFDAWDLDVAMTASQKSFWAPPGIAALAVSPRAWEAHASSKMPRYFWDVSMAKTFAAKGQTPFTPPISLYFGIDEALKLIEAEGLPAIFARHEKLAMALRRGLQASGLELFVKHDAEASRGVTAIVPPDGLTPLEVRKALDADFGMVVAPGQGDLADKIFRIGHLGTVDAVDILAVIAALEVTLTKLGAKLRLGEGVKAAQQALLQA